ncbi:hypothetical protein TeGR_g8314, partial [Tetraparma gracilis]
MSAAERMRATGAHERNRSIKRDRASAWSAGKASELVEAALAVDPHSLPSLLPSDVLPILWEADLHSAFEAGLENLARRQHTADSSHPSALGALLASAWYGDPVLLATLSEQFPRAARRHKLLTINNVRKSVPGEYS